MKKYITATIGSAVIVPGFGQVLNGQTKKGLILMASVFLLIIGGAAKLILIFLPVINSGQINMEEILSGIDFMDILILRIILILLLAVWIYSIIDACIYGIRIERERKQD
jgi:hypothetical protein